VLAALLALGLAGSPAAMQQATAKLDAKAAPSVATVRSKLVAMRELETAAQRLLARGEQLPQVHRALAHGWAQVEAAETELQVSGEGERLERAAIRAMAEARAADAHLLKTWEQGDRHEINPALQACWQEHLLSTDKPDSLEVKVTVSLEKGHVAGVELAPPLTGFRAHLAECLKTRLLGWALEGDADAAELTLRFAPP